MRKKPRRKYYLCWERNVSLTSLSVVLRDVSNPIPWQNNKIDWDTLAGASDNTSPTSSSLRILVLVLLACWYMVSVVWRKLDLSPTRSRVSQTRLEESFSEISVRLRNASTKQRRFLLKNEKYFKITRILLGINFTGQLILVILDGSFFVFCLKNSLSKLVKDKILLSCGVVTKLFKLVLNDSILKQIF